MNDIEEIKFLLNRIDQLKLILDDVDNNKEDIGDALRREYYNTMLNESLMSSFMNRYEKQMGIGNYDWYNV